MEGTLAKFHSQKNGHCLSIGLCKNRLLRGYFQTKQFQKSILHFVEQKYIFWENILPQAKYQIAWILIIDIDGFRPWNFAIQR